MIFGTFRIMTFMFGVSFSTFTVLLIDDIIIGSSFNTDQIASFSLGCQIYESIIFL